MKFLAVLLKWTEIKPYRNEKVTTRYLTEDNVKFRKLSLIIQSSIRINHAIGVSLTVRWLYIFSCVLFRVTAWVMNTQNVNRKHPMNQRKNMPTLFSLQFLRRYLPSQQVVNSCQSLWQLCVYISDNSLWVFCF